MAERALALEERYTYKRLNVSKTGSFRILQLQPGGKDAPIFCNLVRARLDVKTRRRRGHLSWTCQPAYEAISYVWGSSDRPIPINCDGKRLYITENLKDALVRVRLPDRPRSLWADSICIDQDNLEEKGRQVQLMGKIYSIASRVLICLGNDDEGHAQKAMSFVKDVSNMIAETLPKCEQTYDSFPYLAADDPSHYDDRWLAYYSMLSQPWFHRGWVVQEAALGRHVVVLWGEAECNWISLLETEIWVKRRGQLPYTLDQGGPPTLLHIHFYESINTDKTRLRPLKWPSTDSEALSVPYFMGTARQLILSNPVDRVFAFLEIFAKISNGALVIKPDYSKTPHSVYTDFAVAYLQATGDLDLLQWVQHTNESLELETPSWVPLWDTLRWSLNWNALLARKHDSSEHFTLEQDSGIPRLTVQALLFDTIRFASDMLLLETFEDVFQLWQIIQHMDESADVHRFLQTICLGGRSGDLNTWDLQFLEYGRHLLTSSSSSNLDGDFPLVQEIMRAVTGGRRFVLTESKAFYGLIPVVATQTDICTFVSGAWCPFCIRQTENAQEYKIVGDAYFLSHDISFCRSGYSVYKDSNNTAKFARSRVEEQTITLI